MGAFRGDLMAKNVIEQVAQWLVIIGGLNWGLVGAFSFNLVEKVFGAWPVVVKLVYILVGLSALWVLYAMFKK